MNGKKLVISVLACALVLALAPQAHAGPPSWVRPALRYLVRNGHLDRTEFRANRRMKRAAFKDLMHSVFGRGYRRERGYVRAREVSRALVRVLGERDVVRSLMSTRSPDGWAPGLTRGRSFEVVARELGLRHDRPTSEERFEAGAGDFMRQADVVYAVWRATTSPSTWGAQTLLDLRLPDYTRAQRKVVSYAMTLLGTPYVWAGEWPARTGAGYPYGAQSAGGFDCSGLIWYVLKRRSASYSPIDRPYRGWRLDERSSADMARRAPTRIPYRRLRPGDIAFFSADGRRADPSTVYHAAIYLGKGWVVHSSGSRAGPSLGFIGRGSWWRSQFAWGRRVIGRA